jgi:two-component system sensor histidine kinase YesM
MNDSEIRVENVLIINDGEVISSWDKELIGTSFTGKDTFNAKYNGKTCRFLYYENGNASVWSYVAIVSQREIYAASRSIVQFFVFTSLICIICIILASYLVSRSISKPLEYLSGAMQDIGNNNLNIELKAPNYQDEVGKMWGCLIEMKDTLKKSMDDSRAAMEQNQRLRLEALKAQINPHFLYNTFGSVIYLVEEGKKEEAIEMLVALSELLHISLSRSQELITVEQELGLLRRYMDIQKVRYENRFRYLIDVDIDIMKLYMVKIVLQPVVENVLEHGLKQKADIQALICIRGWREKELLIFEVSDNCNTLTFQRMEEVNRKIHGTEPARAAKTGIGLKNVNDRICYEFSNDKRLGVWMAKREKETVTRIVLKVEEGLDDGTI